MDEVEVGTGPIEIREEEKTQPVKIAGAFGKNWGLERDSSTDTRLSTDAKLTANAAGRLCLEPPEGERDFDVLIFAGGMVRERKVQKLSPITGSNDTELNSSNHVDSVVLEGEDGLMSEAEAMLRYSLRTNNGLFEKISKVVVHDSDGNYHEHEPGEFLPPSMLRKLRSEQSQNEESKKISDKNNVNGSEFNKKGLVVYLLETAVDTVSSAKEAKEVLMEKHGSELQQLPFLDDNSAILTVGYHLNRTKKDLDNYGMTMKPIASENLLAGQGNPHLLKYLKKRKFSPRIVAEHGRETAARFLQVIDPKGTMVNAITDILRRGNTKVRI